MGAYASVGIPENKECGMIETSGHSVAWCLVEMCSPWMDGSIRQEDFKGIPSAAAKTAHEKVPSTLAAYNAWRHLAMHPAYPIGPGRMWEIGKGDWLHYPFDEAREFLRIYAESTSTEDIKFNI